MESENNAILSLFFDLLERTILNVDQLKKLKQISKEFGIQEDRISEFMEYFITYLLDVLEKQKKRLPKFIYRLFISQSSNYYSNQNQNINERNSEEKNSKIKELEGSLIQRDELLEKIAQRLDIIRKKIAD